MVDAAGVLPDQAADLGQLRADKDRLRISEQEAACDGSGRARVVDDAPGGIESDQPATSALRTVHQHRAIGMHLPGIRSSDRAAVEPDQSTAWAKMPKTDAVALESCTVP